MEQKLSQRIETAEKSGGFIHIILPTENAGVFESYKISVANFLSGLKDEPKKYTNITGNTTVNFAPKDYVEMCFVKPLTGNPVVRIGTTLTGNDILEDTLINQVEKIALEKHFTAGGSLYFGVSDGNIDLTIFYKENVI